MRVGRIAAGFVVAVGALGLWPIASCTRSTPGIRVDAEVRLPPTPTGFDTDEGYRVSLESARVNLALVELGFCDEIALASLFRPARARAHLNAAPGALGEPSILDVIENNGIPQNVGFLEPIPDDYCDVLVVFAPVDDDVVGRPVDGSLDGISLELVGTARRLADDAEFPFAVGVADEVRITLPFETFSLESAEDQGTLSFAADHRRWFDGIDFATFDATGVALLVRQNLRNDLQVVTSVR